MHPFPFTRTKSRGVPRKLRALQSWAAGFEGFYPSPDELQGEYWNHKIPVEHSLVESRHTTREVRKACAQELINACFKLQRSKPEGVKNHRVVAVVCLPDMFTSELCIYLQEDYFLEHTTACNGAHGSANVITGTRLSEHWELNVPDGMGELGMALDYRRLDDKSDWFVGERWYFGEVRQLPLKSVALSN